MATGYGQKFIFKRKPAVFDTFRNRALFWSFCVAVCLFAGSIWINHIEQKIQAKNERIIAAKRVYDVSAHLSSSMFVRLNLTSSLQAFVTTNPSFSTQEFGSFASILKKNLNGVISLQLAPDGVVTYLTDLQRNKAALGHNLLADPGRRDIALRSIKERSHIISGPVNLIQGGAAIIARRPIYFPAENSDGDYFWGFATVLVDIYALLNDASITVLEDDYEVAIRGRDGLGSDGDVFFGNERVFDSALAISDILLPDASWQIAVKAKGHDTHSFIGSKLYWVTSCIVTLLSSILAYSFFDAPRKLKMRVNAATAQLSEEIRTRVEAEERARHMAQHDFLTLLPNRLLFDELGKLSIASAKREGLQLAFLFVDVDEFKKVNDSYGHTIGDEALKIIAQRVRDRIRESDIVARFGGDEFIVLLKEKCDVAGAKQVASEIINSISKSFFVHDHEVKVGASIGIAMYPEHGLTVEELLRSADAAMYEAKKSGKNSYQFA
jgi:diguanylate cyclase (GGDEF)-like protein